MGEVIVALVTAVFAFFAGLLVNAQGRTQFFSSTVSKERMAWIYDIRGLCAELFSVCEQYDPENLPAEALAAFLKARNGILIRLDPLGWYITDDELIQLLSEPDFVKVREHLPRIRLLITTILKNEWDKVKIEAGNSLWKVKRIEKLQERLKSDQYHGD